MAKNAGEFSFSDLNKEMSKNSKWGGLMSDGAGVSEILITYQRVIMHVMLV